MKNKTLINIAKQLLKDLLAKCTQEQQLIFKRIYCHQGLELPIDVVVEHMDPVDIDIAISQAEQSLKKNISTPNRVSVRIDLDNDEPLEAIFQALSKINVKVERTQHNEEEEFSQYLITRE